MKTLLLMSGGLDSTTALFDLRTAGHEVRGLGIDYGQRHFRELEAARKIAQDFNISFEIADLSPLKKFLGGSSQTSDLAVPEGHYTQDSMKLTVVPNRNMIMLSIAIGYAISLKFDAVAYAAHAGDHTIYPDCRPEFVEAVKKTAELCDWHHIKIITPFLNSSKSEIVKRGAELGVPFQWTWSCYKGESLHCGKCGTCVERKEAFQMAGIEDPTSYQMEGGN
jgi:7-cyano-7-deazaguanine synthase